MAEHEIEPGFSATPPSRASLVDPVPAGGATLLDEVPRARPRLSAGIDGRTDSPPPRRRHRLRGLVGKVKKGLLQCLGPGLVTGASDDDPSGVATYSQAGAKFGNGLLWSTFFTLPLMTAVQEISARIGRTTGRGIAANLRKYYSRWLAVPLVVLLLVANVINIGADLGAMGAATRLVTAQWGLAGPATLYAVVFAVLSTLLQVFIPYCNYARYIKWLCLVLFTYVGVAFALHVNWGEVLRDTVLPAVAWNAEYLSLLVAVLGTTISPYLFFWQASMEVEDLKAAPDEAPLKNAPEQARAQLRRIKLDTYVGMTFSNLIAFFIMLSAAAALHAHGKVDIESAQDAAEALAPTGAAAFYLFSIGIIGTGLLAIPVLAGSGAYALGELLKWPTGLERKVHQAKGFYFILAAATLVGTGMLFIPHLDPIRALIWTAVINGVVAVPLMVVMMLMAGNGKVMGKMARVSRPLRLVGWLATAVMLAAVVGMFWTMGK